MKTPAYKLYLNVNKRHWSSGHMRRLVFKRSWVQIPAPAHFSHLFVVKTVWFALKDLKINKKEADDGPWSLMVVPSTIRVLIPLK